MSDTQIQKTTDLSFRQSRFKSGAVGAQVSLSCDNADRKQALKTFQRVMRDTCLDDRIGRSLLNVTRGIREITKTSPCNEDPLTPHFYIVKLGFTGVYIILLFLL